MRARVHFVLFVYNNRLQNESPLVRFLCFFASQIQEYKLHDFDEVILIIVTVFLRLLVVLAFLDMRFLCCAILFSFSVLDFVPFPYRFSSACLSL